MEQLEFFEIPSPCRGICEVNHRGLCRGCLRSREERFHWQAFTDSQKREVLRLCTQRRHKLILEAIAARQQAADAAQPSDENDLFEETQDRPASPGA